ncbi:MAG: GNAT family N-acetyltransferase [Anaerolineae bacterium]|nr:GNAT family N-acetyltransferase [Anaerolineae bacterium]
MRTKRLLLRDVQHLDFLALHQLRSNPVVTRYMTYLISENEQETREWIQGTMYHNALSPRQSYNLTVVRQSDEAILGWIGAGHSDTPHYGDVDFGYALLPVYWGQGYATEAVRAVLAIAFDRLGAQSVYGECDARNVASARVMEKAGLRRIPAVDDDDIIYAITRAQWESS